MTKFLRKFNFFNADLAFRVRNQVWNSLTKFDRNLNGKFESSEIRQALITLLGESQMEVQYVVNNVFRYDVDADQAVTYTQFTNFCVQQHFGEMAIQRLHRKQFYTNGAKRIMSYKEFHTTLDYCLEFIGMRGSKHEYEELFNSVDIDRDGFITYQDYFIFLRQYFGSQSEAVEEQKKNPKPISNNLIQHNQVDEIEFVKWVMLQYKLRVMQSDTGKKLRLYKKQVEYILSKILRISNQKIGKGVQQCLSRTTNISYEEFMKKSITFYLSQMQKESKYLKKGEVATMQLIRAFHFIKLPPTEEMTTKFITSFRRNPSVALFEQIKMAFSRFQFDKRGISAKLGKKLYQLA